MVDQYREKFKCFDDPNFNFNPKYHQYTYNGRKYTSVTKFLENFHTKFDTEYWSKKKSEEYGIEQSELLKQWKEKNEYANFVGSSTHDWLESYFNQIYKPLPTNLDVIDRINKFNKIFATHLYKLDPVKFELRIFSKKYPIAGTLDSIFLYKNKLFIVDYKTNGDFTHNDHPNGKYEKLLYPFNDFYKNHLNDYSIQVSFYALILKEWGFDVRGGYLLYIGPNDDAKFYKCENMVDKLESFLENFNWG